MILMTASRFRTGHQGGPVRDAPAQAISDNQAGPTYPYTRSLCAAAAAHTRTRASGNVAARANASSRLTGDRASRPSPPKLHLSWLPAPGLVRRITARYGPSLAAPERAGRRAATRRPPSCLGTDAGLAASSGPARSRRTSGPALQREIA